jgi:Pyruvate/2-oxoacid:ferredoxin oxidoreductase gamma subunit
LEWRAQPTIAYVKASKTPFTSRDLPAADFLLVFDTKLSADATADANEKTTAIFNCEKLSQDIKKKVTSHYLPATNIAISTMKNAYPNTAMLGAVCKIFNKFTLRSIKQATEIELKGIGANGACIDEGFKCVKRG